MCLMAQAVKNAGVKAIRAQGVLDIKQIKEQTNLPVIGIIKKSYEGYASYITATMDEVDKLVEAGSDIIALDCTNRERGDGKTPSEFVEEIKEKYPNVLLMADISNLEEAIEAERAGVDFVGTTMNGYTPYTANSKKFNPDLVKEIVKNVKVPLILKEVGFGMSPDTVKKGMELGIKTFDISGRGGTSFAYIENMRGENRFSYLNEWGQSTVSCLLGLKDYINKTEIIASGGVRHPLDIIKALVLGAKAVGLSGTMLRLAENNSTEEIIEIVNSWKEECRMIMCALNAKSVKELQNVKYVLYGKTREFCLK